MRRRTWLEHAADRDRAMAKHLRRYPGHWLLVEVDRVLCGPDDCDAVIWRSTGRAERAWRRLRRRWRKGARR